MDVEINSSNSQRTSEIQLVVFRLVKEQYGLPITKVIEIDRMEPITKLPHTPDFMEGIINLRGKIIPIIDLRKRFQYFVSEYTDDTRVIIVQIGNDQVGIIVDAVTEIISLSTRNIEPPPDTFTDEKIHIQGIGKRNQDLITMLNIDKIMTSQEANEMRQFNA